MSFYITTKTGELLLVQTIVGEGTTRVELVPVSPREPADMEPREESAS